MIIAYSTSLLSLISSKLLSSVECTGTQCTSHSTVCLQYIIYHNNYWKVLKLMWHCYLATPGVTLPKVFFSHINTYFPTKYWYLKQQSMYMYLFNSFYLSFHSFFIFHFSHLKQYPVFYDFLLILCMLCKSKECYRFCHFLWQFFHWTSNLFKVKYPSFELFHY